MDFADPHERLQRRQAFGAVARSYADLRPTYPDALVDAVAQGRLRVDVAPFEEWPLPPAPFDLVLCATAWHWLDPAVRVDKAAAALRPGGVLAVVWTHVVRGGTPGFDEAADPVLRRRGQAGESRRGLTAEADLEPRTAELTASGAFADVGSRLFPVEVGYSADDVAALHGTYSSVLRLPPEQREGLLDDLRELVVTRFGGSVVRRYAFELVLARRSAVGGSH